MPAPTLAADYNRYMMVRGNPLKYTDSTGHVYEPTGGISAGYVETIAPLMPRNDYSRREVYNAVHNWMAKHPNYDPSTDPRLDAGQKIVANGLYQELHENLGNYEKAAYHWHRALGMDDPNISAEMAPEMLDNGFSTMMGGPMMAVPVVARGARAPEFSGGAISQNSFEDLALDYLGPGYTQPSPDRYVSDDGLRQVRYGTHETTGNQGHHAHFEAYDTSYFQGGRVIENTRVDILP